MIYRSKAPLRLGLAGGGTDVSPYSDIYGGAILNATISMYAYATIIPRNDGKIILNSLDKGEKYELDSEMTLAIDGSLDLHKGVYNRIIKDFIGKNLSFELATFVDAPPGSGLGTSSTLVVSIMGAFAEWLNLPLGEYDIAKLSYDVERVDLAMAGGKQDQYAATFGGVNYMEFSKEDKVIVNPLRIKTEYLNELAYNLILFNTETSRLSSSIIEKQAKNIIDKESKSIEATHQLKEQAVRMKETLLTGDIDQVGEILDYGWKHKKMLAEGITNPIIDKIYTTAKSHGSTGGKISGAGGGGFIIFYCPNNSRNNVINSLKPFGNAKRYEFTNLGLTTWSA